MKNVLKNILFICFTLTTLISCEEILMENDISDEEMVLVAPANNAQFTSTSIAFTWENIENATGYRLQIAKPNFTDPVQIVLDTIVSSSSFTQQLNIGQYEWRVKAVNSSYQTAYKNRFLTISSNDDFENNTVTLSAPANFLVTKIAVQNLSWQPVIGATNYQIQILDSNGAIVNDQTTTASTLSYTFSQGSFQWRVRAGNGTDYTLYTVRNILVDTTVPNTPALTAPVNGASQLEGSINFTWNRTAVAGSNEKDSIYIYTNSGLTNLYLKNEAQSPFTSTLNSGTYYWFVKAFDQAGNSSAQSSVFNFTLN